MWLRCSAFYLHLYHLSMSHRSFIIKLHVCFLFFSILPNPTLYIHTSMHISIYTYCVLSPGHSVFWDRFCILFSNFFTNKLWLFWIIIIIIRNRKVTRSMCLKFGRDHPILGGVGLLCQQVLCTCVTIPKLVNILLSHLGCNITPFLKQFKLNRGQSEVKQLGLLHIALRNIMAWLQQPMN